MSWVTFSGGHWGSYREFDGNRIAVSFKYVIPDNRPNNNYKVQVALFEWGQQALSQGHAIAYNENEVYSFVEKYITPVSMSYRFWYETNSYSDISVYIVAIPYTI